jgi:hypothetical protein
VSQLNRASFASLIALCCHLSGCQPLDESAAMGEPFMGNTEGKAAALETPALELADGRIAKDACEAVRLQAYEVLTAPFCSRAARVRTQAIKASPRAS